MISIFRNLYLYYFELTQSHIPALLLLSLTTSALMFLLNWLFRVYPKREATTQSILTSQIREIKARYRGAEAQLKIHDLFRRYRYHPIYALRSALPLFFQLPFLFAAYHALSDLPALSGIRFGIIADLSLPDAMILGYNVLPFLMTGINLLTALLNPAFRFKEKLQAIFIALFFLALLYKAPAALLIYWTANNFIFLLRILAQRFFTKGSKPVRDADSSKQTQVLPFYAIKVLIPFFMLIFLSNLLQFIADGEGIFIYRFSKTVPLLVASMAAAFLMLKHSSFPYQKWGLTILALPLLLLLLLHLSGVYLIPTNRYVIFAWLAGFYLLICAFLTIYQCVSTGKEKVAHKVSTVYGKWDPALWVILLFTPSLHLAAANPDYLSAWFYPLFLLLPFVIFALSWLMLKLSDAFIPLRLRDGRLSISYALCFSILFCFLPVLRALMQKNSAHDGDFWAILLLAMTLIWLYRRLQLPDVQTHEVQALAVAPSNNNRSVLSEARTNHGGTASAGTPLTSLRIRNVLNTIFIVLFLAALTNFVVSLINGETSSKRELQQLPPALQNLQIKDKPNIYLFVYDGLPNPRVFREQNLPLQPMLELFDKYGYKVYEDTYTIGNESLNSMAMTLNISDEQYKSMSKMQDIYSGNSVANLLLTDAGYGSFNLLENYFTGTYAITNEDLVTEYFPPKELSAVQSDFFLTLFRGVLQGEFRFDTKGIMVADRYTEADRQNRKHELIRDGISPKFVIDQVSKPSHSQNSGKCLPNETDLWIKRYMEALDYLKHDLEALHQHDPDAIAIFIGDHGPSLLGDCYILQNWKLEDITPELMWDRIGTMIAIHWPNPDKAAKYDTELAINQDLFAVIFAYLADDPAPLKLMPDRTFSGYELLTRPAVRFREGRVLN